MDDEILFRARRAARNVLIGFAAILGFMLFMAQPALIGFGASLAIAWVVWKDLEVR